MNHFVAQNGPFCDVIWPILKITMISILLLYELFTASRAFFILKSKKYSHLFSGKKNQRKANL